MKFKNEFYAEQGPDTVLQILQGAAESGQKVKLFFVGDFESTQKVFPYSFEGDTAWFVTQNGDAIAKKISEIKMVQLPEDEQPVASGNGTKNE